MDLARNNPSSVVHVAALASVFRPIFFEALLRPSLRVLLFARPRLFKRWITIHRINHYPVINIRKTDCAIQRIEINPIDSVILIHLVNNWGRFNIFTSHHHFEWKGRYRRKIPPMKADEIRTSPANSELRNCYVKIKAVRDRDLKSSSDSGGYHQFWVTPHDKLRITWFFP